MKEEKQEQESTTGLTQILEVINAKGDTGELEEIIQRRDENEEITTKGDTELK